MGGEKKLEKSWRRLLVRTRRRYRKKSSMFLFGPSQARASLNCSSHGNLLSCHLSSVMPGLFAFLNFLYVGSQKRLNFKGWIEERMDEPPTTNSHWLLCSAHVSNYDSRPESLHRKTVFFFTTGQNIFILCLYRFDVNWGRNAALCSPIRPCAYIQSR